MNGNNILNMINKRKPLFTWKPNLKWKHHIAPCWCSSEVRLPTVLHTSLWRWILLCTHPEKPATRWRWDLKPQSAETEWTEGVYVQSQEHGNACGTGTLGDRGLPSAHKGGGLPNKTVSAPGLCGWYSGHGFSSDDNFVPAEGTKANSQQGYQVT